MKITILGVNEVQAVLNQKLDAVDAVISIWDDPDRGIPPALERFREAGFPVLSLRMDDIEYEPPEENDWQIPPKEWQVVAAVNFARELRHKNPDTKLLIHCFAGISRSAAIAMVIMADELGPGHEISIQEELIRLRPRCAPNTLIASLGDIVLNRTGELSRVAAHLDATWGHRTFPEGWVNCG